MLYWRNYDILIESQFDTEDRTWEELIELEFEILEEERGVL